MNWLRRLWHRADQEKQLDKELQFHIGERIAYLRRTGLSEEEARRNVYQEFGGLEQVKEDCRDARGTRWLEDFWRDIRFTARQMRKIPSFTVVAVLTLAVGIGASTAMFSAVYGVLLRPFPYAAPQRLAAVWCSEPSRGIPRMGCALPDLQEIATRNHSFEGLASYYFGDVNITGTTGGTPERVSGLYGTANLFPLLGVNPELGRVFSSSEEAFGKHQVVVLSDAIWKRLFGARNGVIGESLRLNDQLYTVIGVMPPDFRFPSSSAQLWMPLSFAPDDLMATRNNHFIDAIVRLRPGATVDNATADIQSIARDLQNEFSENAGVEANMSDYTSSAVGDVRTVLRILLGAVGILLLVACANVSNLLLSKASGRQREIAVRAALGASRGRLVRQLIGEGVLLAALGACLGVALSVWLVHLIRTFGPANIPRLGGIGIDGWTLAFMAGLTLISVLIFGLAPAMTMARAQVNDSLKDRSQAAGLQTNRSRNALVIAEITLSVVLVVGAGLLFKTWRQLQRVNPGFRPDNVLTMSISLPAAKYPASEAGKTARFYEDLTRRVEQMPGVKAVGASTALPIAGWGGWGKYFTVDGKHPMNTIARRGT